MANRMNVSLASMAGFAVALGLLIGIGVMPAAAHDDDHHRVQGQKLKMTDPAGRPEKRKFIFKTKRQIFINDSLFDEDPTVFPSYLNVRGVGASDGATDVIKLDPANWRAAGKKGFRYKNDFRDPSSNGVQKIVLKTSSKGGKLLIKAKGEHWDYEIVGPQEAVEISLTMGPDVYCAGYQAGDEDDELRRNEPGKLIAKSADPLADCVAVCGNAIRELGEQCDDGNGVDADTCSNVCEGCAPQQNDFSSTFEGIQELVFDSEVFDCSTDLCHGSSQQGGLDLRSGLSHAQLINVPGQIDPNLMRVFPGDDDRSLLYAKLANKLNGEPPVAGTPMPQNAPALTPELLEVMRLWIRGGAPETGVVEGTADLLGTCLPEPTPLKIPQPDPPAQGDGVQVAMPGWPLPAQSEDEICVPSYYDFSDPAIVPAQFRVDCTGLFPGTNDPPNGTGECFAYRENNLFQDAQSHHSIIHIYAGDFDHDDPGWGTWTCYLGDDDGQPCDPTDANACPGGVCGGDWKSGVACLALGGFGPPDYSNFNNKAPTWSGSQEPTQSFPFPAGVYNLLPLKGVIVWNSHAFNLTSTDMNMEGWVNLEFTDNQQWRARGLFNDDQIFVQNVPPFESREYCYTHTFPSGTRLFELSSHMHKRGKRWRYYQAPQTPCASPSGCSPGSEGDKFYESFDYSDPLGLTFDPPRHYTGSTADRTIKFCALYDNGELDPAEVKTRSGSPCPPPLTSCPNGTGIGGPCAAADAACLGGPNKGQPCNGDDGLCPDSVCDACPLRGGVTTEDEMFIAIGTYYIDP